MITERQEMRNVLHPINELATIYITSDGSEFTKKYLADTYSRDGGDSRDKVYILDAKSMIDRRIKELEELKVLMEDYD